MMIDNGIYTYQFYERHFYICANPFIYATKFDPVRRVLKDLIFCKKASAQIVPIV